MDPNVVEVERGRSLKSILHFLTFPRMVTKLFDHICLSPLLLLSLSLEFFFSPINPFLISCLLTLLPTEFN